MLSRLRPEDPWAYGVWGLAAAALFAFFILPGMVVDASDFARAQDRVKAENDVRTAALQLLAGFVLVVGSYFTARTLRLNREGHITDRFSKAVDQLGEPQLSTRLGGIYALERVMKDAPGDQGPILEILTAFVRDNARGSRPDEIFPPEETRAAIRVIGRRKVEDDPVGYKLNLSTTNLCSVSLEKRNFAEANLWQTNLRRGFLREANLVRAYLRCADLTNANLAGADLREANLREAHLPGATIDGANFEGARYDDDTVWPRDVSPELLGAVRVED